MEITSTDLQKFVSQFIRTSVDGCNIVMDELYPVITDAIYNIPVLLITSPQRFVLLASNTSHEQLKSRKNVKALLMSKQVLKKIRATKGPEIVADSPAVAPSENSGYIGGFLRRQPPNDNNGYHSSRRRNSQSTNYNQQNNRRYG